MYREHSAGAGLSRWVECVWSVQSAVPLDYGVRPDGCLDVVYSPDSGLRAVGAMTTEQRFHLAAGAAVAGVRFRPGFARQFLRSRAGELTGKVAPLDQLWGKRAAELERRLSGAASAEHGGLILQALGAPAAAPDAVVRAIEAMSAAHGAIDVDWASEQAGMSARQFRRRCLEESGLTPKHLCRVLRFRRSLQLAARRGVNWAAVAADAGYFDQAHLIRDFREFTGQTPMAVFSNTPMALAGENQA